MQGSIPKPVLKNKTTISSANTGDPPPRKLLDRVRDAIRSSTILTKPKRPMCSGLSGTFLDLELHFSSDNMCRNSLKFFLRNDFKHSSAWAIIVRL